MKRVAATGLMSSLSSVETMQKSVMNAFSLKYSECVGYLISIDVQLLFTHAIDAVPLYRGGYWSIRGSL